MSNSHFKWMLGWPAEEKISFIAKQYYTSRRSSIKSIFGTDVCEYRPWMSPRPTEERFMDHRPTQKKCEVDTEYQKDYEKRLRACEAFTLFDEDVEDPLEVYSDICEHHAEASENFDRSVLILSECCPWIYRLFDNLVADVIPIRRNSRVFGAGSATNHHLIGTLFLSLRANPNAQVKSVISLAHEVGHTSLMIYQNGDSITIEPENTLVYSPVRRVNRPLIMSFHAVVAAGFMIECAKGLRLRYPATTAELSYLEALISDLRRELKTSLEQLNGMKLTRLGQCILADVSQSVL